MRLTESYNFESQECCCHLPLLQLYPNLPTKKLLTAVFGEVVLNTRLEGFLSISIYWWLNLNLNLDFLRAHNLNFTGPRNQTRDFLVIYVNHRSKCSVEFFRCTTIYFKGYLDKYLKVLKISHNADGRRFPTT